MLKQIEHFISEQGLIDKSKPVLVGTSGGLDSVVLLHILHRLGFNCIAAHCNFHLRGDESNRDEIFVKDLCTSLKIPFLKADFDTTEYAKEHKISIEMAARELRYKWFDEMSVEHKAPSIAIAHHADDSIETILLNLTRGTGIKGLLGISAKNGKVVRPLIQIPRSEIEQFAQINKIDFIVDSTNLENDFARNKIRNQVIPILSQINPSASNNILQSSNYLKDVWLFLNSKIEEIEKDIVHTIDNQIFIDIDKLNQLNNKNLILYEILRKFDFNADVVNDILNNLAKNQSGLKYYSFTHRLINDRKYLIIQELKVDDEQVYQINLSDGKITEPIDLDFRVFKRDDNFKFSSDPNLVHIDFDKIEQGLELRKWREGDYFYPLGMNQRKKLSDFFTDIKISIFEKEKQYLLCSGKEIVWIVGRRLDNRYKISPKSKNILEFRYNL